VATPPAAAPAAAANPPAATEPNAGLPGAGAIPSGWWDAVKDTEVKNWVATKGYPDAESALKAQWGLERMMGADKAGRTVMLPKDDADTEGWKAFGQKLGVPANAEEYKLPVPEGQDDGFAKLASGWMQKANIPPSMARALTTEWNAYTAQVQAQLKADSDAKVAALNTEWGPKATENTEMARRGFREFAEKFGLKTDPTKFEDAVGSADFLKFFLGLGSLNAEIKFAGGDGKGGFGMPATEARAKYSQNVTDRAAGKIDDYLWRTEIEPMQRKLEQIIVSQPS
jgi:hypothetical protein